MPDTNEPVSRRAVLLMCAGAVGSGALGRRMPEQPPLTRADAMMDHLLLGAADLDRGIDWVEKTTGVRAAIGGVHPGRGTRNALLSLGGRQYLEIIAPDPAQPPANLTMNLRGLTEPRLIGWAAAASDIDRLAKNISGQGLQIFGPRDGSRARPDGKTLKWRTLAAATTFGGGDVDPIPFFIQWSADSLHPSQDSPPGCRLAALEFGHPDADALRTQLRQLGIDAVVRAHKTVRLVSTLDTPKGRTVIA